MTHSTVITLGLLMFAKCVVMGELLDACGFGVASGLSWTGAILAFLIVLANNAAREE